MELSAFNYKRQKDKLKLNKKWLKYIIDLTAFFKPSLTNFAIRSFSFVFMQI